MAQELALSYGVDVTSNYISKGSTQTEDHPAVQPYVEAAYGLFYGGLWASNVKFGGATDMEYDVYAGITPSWRNVDFDMGFARYFYRDDNTNYGEAYIKTDWAVSDRVTLGLDYYREVYADQIGCISVPSWPDFHGISRFRVGQAPTLGLATTYPATNTQWISAFRGI